MVDMKGDIVRYDIYKCDQTVYICCLRHSTRTSESTIFAQSQAWFVHGAVQHATLFLTLKVLNTHASIPEAIVLPEYQ